MEGFRSPFLESTEDPPREELRRPFDQALLKKVTKSVVLGECADSTLRHDEAMIKYRTPHISHCNTSFQRLRDRERYFVPVGKASEPSPELGYPRLSGIHPIHSLYVKIINSRAYLNRILVLLIYICPSNVQLNELSSIIPWC